MISFINQVLIAIVVLAICIPLTFFAYLWICRPSPWERRPSPISPIVMSNEWPFTNCMIP